MKLLPIVRKTNSSGQALLIVLLAMAVILTIVLSVSSRSISDVTVTSYEEDALRAFSAAEAGVEEALLSPYPHPIPLTNPDSGDTSVSYEGAVTIPIETDNNFLYPDYLSSGEVATFWLVSHAADGSMVCGGLNPCYNGTVSVCWDAPAIDPRAAIEVMVFYDPSGNSVSSNNFANVQVWRHAYDRFAATRGNNFDSSVGGGCPAIDSVAFNNRTQINLGADVGCGALPCRPLLVKVRMYYGASQRVGLTWSGGGFPAQGILISSTGVAGGSTRKVNVFQTYPNPPTIFDSAIFSMSDLVK